MGRVLFFAGHVKPTIRANIKRRFRVAWCRVCEADRVLTNPRVWSGWPKDDAPHTGECISCGSTVSVSSGRPGPEAA